MKRSSVRKNYIYNTAVNVLTLLVPLVTTPYASRVLGADNVGIYSFSSSVVSFFLLFATFGSTIYGSREISINANNIDKLSQSFWNIFSFRILSAAVMSALYIIYVVFYSENFLIALIYCLTLVNVAVDITWYFQGTEQFKIVAIRTFIIKIVAMIMILTIVKNESDLWKYVLIETGQLIAGNLLTWVVLKGQIHRVKQWHPFNGFGEMISVFLPTIAVQIYYVLDKSMLGWIVKSNYANGCYEQSEKLARVGLVVVTSLAAVVMPEIAHLYSENKIEEVKSHVYKSYRMTFMIALPLAAGLIVSAPLLIPVYLGEGYEYSVILLRILSLLPIFVGVAYTTGYSYLISTKQQNVYTVSVSVAAVVNLLMNALLIPKFSAIGVAIATVLAEFIGAFIQMAYCIVKKQLRLTLIFGCSWKYFVAASIMFIAEHYLCLHLDTSIRSLILVIASGMILYAALLTVMRDGFFIDNVKAIIKRKKT